MRTSIDPNDRDAIIWLQVTLTNLLGDRAPRVRIGTFDSITRKMLEMYQQRNGLPLTGEADEATLQHIQQA